jgi:hypothetical protein
MRFPNARYVISDREWDFWSDPERHGPFPERFRGMIPGTQAAFKLIADRTTRIKAGTEIVSGIATVESRGHTLGHMSVQLASGGEQALVVGDAITQVPTDRNEPAAARLCFRQSQITHSGAIQRLQAFVFCLRKKKDLSAGFFFFLFCFLKSGPVQTPTPRPWGRGGWHGVACPSFNPALFPGLGGDPAYAAAAWARELGPAEPPGSDRCHASTSREPVSEFTRDPFRQVADTWRLRPADNQPNPCGTPVTTSSRRRVRPREALSTLLELSGISAVFS